MAKVSFNKLNKIKNLSAITYNLDGNIIEIEQYLPLNDKVNLITGVIEQAGNGEEGFFNIVKLDAYYRIEMVKAYTNINFTDKQLEDPTKIYDALILNDIWAFIEDKIPITERQYIWNNILELARQVTSYNSSAMGIVKMLIQNKDEINLDLTDVMDKLNDPEALKLLKEMVGLTGITE